MDLTILPGASKAAASIIRKNKYEKFDDKEKSCIFAELF